MRSHLVWMAMTAALGLTAGHGLAQQTPPPAKMDNSATINTQTGMPHQNAGVRWDDATRRTFRQRTLAQLRQRAAHGRVRDSRERDDAAATSGGARGG